MNAPRWSIVNPGYSESRRLPHHLSEVSRYMDTRGDDHEVIVVDDGATDDTVSAVGVAARSWSAVRVLSLRQNAGNRAAVRAGMLASRGERRLVTDADGPAMLWQVIHARLRIAVEAVRRG